MLRVPAVANASLVVALVYVLFLPGAGMSGTDTTLGNAWLKKHAMCLSLGVVILHVILHVQLKLPVTKGKTPS